jgi:four helix bundle protein
MSENKMRDYKDLKVWQMALEVACDIIDLAEELPSGFARDIISRQMIDSSASVCANIADGHSSGSNRVFSRNLKVAYGKAKETDTWLHLVKHSKKFAADGIVELADRINAKNVVVLKMLHSLQAKIREQLSTKKQES